MDEEELRLSETSILLWRSGKRGGDLDTKVTNRPQKHGHELPLHPRPLRHVQAHRLRKEFRTLVASPVLCIHPTTASLTFRSWPLPKTFSSTQLTGHPATAPTTHPNVANNCPTSTTSVAKPNGLTNLTHSFTWYKSSWLWM